jgi:uncharacterized protein
MPRRLIRKLSPKPQTLRDAWYFRMFGKRLSDSRLWALNRRAVTPAFGAGLAICFIPLPVHLLLALLVAMLARLNLPVLIGTTLLVNPLTVVPVYYGAFLLGSFLLQQPPSGFDFALTRDWLQNGLGPIWKVLLLGCLVSGFAVGYAGYLALELIWQLSSSSQRLRRQKRRLKP